jgi:hypothetical protein
MTPWLAAALLVAAWIARPPAASAQNAEDDAAPVAPRIELGPTFGLTGAGIEFGVFASVPAGQGPAIELSVSWIPPQKFDDSRVVRHRVAQAQLRVPFGPARRSRRSFVIGVTSARRLEEEPFGGASFFGTDDDDVLPHAGVSLQWPIGPHADFRFDAQGVFTVGGVPPLIPRALAMVVWHPGARR